jgi:hypothetical protein
MPKSPRVIQGRPGRLAHLVAGSDRNRRHQHARAAMAEQPPAETALADDPAGGQRADILRLPNPDWLPHSLTVTGPPEPLAAFRQAACGCGQVPWLLDYDRLEEEWVHRLLAPPPAARGISVPGARIEARQMRDLIESLDVQAAERAPAVSCPLDLNALVPVPARLLRLGPDDPAVLAWMWENWGTTWMLRYVEEVPAGRAGGPVPPGQATVGYRFWSADWTPWRALAAVRTRWPALTLHVRVGAVTE